MKRLLLAIALCLLPSLAMAQCNGVFQNNTVCGNATGQPNLPKPTAPSGFNVGVTAGGNIVPSGTTSTIANEQTPLGGRITLVAGTCIAQTDQVAATTVYFGACTNTGRWVPIYNGTLMQLYQFTASNTDLTGLSLALGSNWASGTNYMAYVTLVNGTPTLCSVAWTNDSTPSVADAYYGAIAVNATSFTCRTSNSTTITVAASQGTKAGWFRTNANAGQVDLKFGSSATGGGVACICIGSTFIPALAFIHVIDTTATWTYNSSTFHQANASTGNQINILRGQTATFPDEIYVTSEAHHTQAGTSSFGGIGLAGSTTVDSRTTNTIGADQDTSSFTPSTASYFGFLPIGYQSVIRLEISNPTGGTTTFIGNNAGYITGIFGKVWY